MLGTLIAFDKNGSDLKTMMLCLCLVREKGANDSISRFNFTREMELFLTGATGLPATEPAGYTEATAYRNYYNKTKYMRAFGMMGLVHNPDSSYKDLALTKRGKAVLDCIDYTLGAAPPFIYSIIKQKKFTSLFVDNFVFGSFGKNNCGLEKSNTDIEYPKILLKTILTTGYVTSGESFYIADGMNEGAYASYEAALTALRSLRALPHYQTTIESALGTLAGGIPGSRRHMGRVNFARDNKIITLLEQINILEVEPSALPKIHKHYVLTQNAKDNFLGKLQLLLPVYRPQQVILSGVPGTGKSYYAENTIMGGNCNPNNVIRTIIHPDYTYSDFVGYQQPKKNPATGKIEFEFYPGPLTKALERCFKAENENVYLVIEEVNRGDLAAVMGDTFQLLDRIDEFASSNHGWSKYPIANKQIYDYLINLIPTLSGKLAVNKIVFPSNLNIIGTMNTADQNVFVLDTAFRRRFRNIYLRIDFSDASDPGSFLYLLDTAAKANVFGGLYSWSDFAQKVNQKIDEINADTFTIPEDKKLAPYFVGIDDVSNPKSFCDKVLYYLKTDVFLYVEDYFLDSYQKIYQDVVLSIPAKNPYDYL